MSLKDAKIQLETLLPDSDIRVLALTGKWGTGKTHLWNEVRQASDDEAVNKAIYASLFGLSSVDQIKRKLVGAIVPQVESDSWRWASLRHVLKLGIKAGSEHFKGLAALNDLSLMMIAPAMLRERVVVLDDIERKHEKLGIDEVLGFIDEYANEHGVRFVLVLNDDKLGEQADQQSMWMTFREKVIDHELKLTTLPEEAFQIAARQTTSAYTERIRRVVNLCEVTNIRIIRKVMKAVTQIMGSRHELSSEVLDRTIPSVALLACIYYKGVSNSPDLSTILKIGSTYEPLSSRDGSEEKSEEEKINEHWRSLFRRLGVVAFDEFEILVVDFLEAGQFDQSKIEKVIQSYCNDEKKAFVENSIRRFFDRSFWDVDSSIEEVVNEAQALVGYASHIDALQVTALHDQLLTMDQGQVVADELIEKWIECFESVQRTEPVRWSNIFGRRPHPAIQAVFEKVNSALEARFSLLDVCRQVRETSSWGKMHERVMASASVADFDELLRKGPTQERRELLIRMLDWVKHRQSYQAHFGSAIDSFIEACRQIVKDPEATRLATLIRNVFKEDGLSELLDA